MEEIDARRVAEAFTSRTQELILLPTEKCNFRCTYCYEDFELGRMPPHVRDGVKRLIDIRVPELDSLTLSWFGGEPLLAIDICKDIAQHAFSLCQEHGVSCYGGFTTNGYKLTTSLVSELQKLNHARFQISLDGYGQQHDRTRRLANGSGTFSVIWQNLLDLAVSDIPFDITLRVHVSPSNVPSVRELLGAINKHFGSDSRFSVFFHRISDLGGAGSQHVEKMSNATYSEVVAELQALIAGPRSNGSELTLTE